jgi:hypothetical protein
MSRLLPPHFALTEAAVALAGAFAIARVARVSPWFAVGLAPFTLAALVGTIRIGAGLIGSIEYIHQLLSRPGALFGLGCLLGVLVARHPVLPPLFGFAATLLAGVIPSAGTPLFKALILLGAASAYRANPGRALLAVASFSVLLIGRLATDPLRGPYPTFAWHSFHLTVAIWLLLLAFYVLPTKPRLLAR